MLRSLGANVARTSPSLVNTVVRTGAASSPSQALALPGTRSASLEASLYHWRQHSIEGQRSLRVVLGITPSELARDEEGFLTQVTRANRRLGPDPAQVLASHGCTREHVVGLAQTFQQVAAQRGFERRTPELLSLMYHLLSACELDSSAVADTARFSTRLMDAVAADAGLCKAMAQWATLSRAQRCTALREAATLVGQAYKASGLSPRDMARDVDLRFSADLPLTAARLDYARPNDVSGHRMTFSEQLLEDGPQARPTCTAGLFLALASHEFMHVLQHQQQIRRSVLDHPTRQDWLAALTHGLSRETEDGIHAAGLDTHDGRRALLPHLPHEKQAWLFNVLVSRAWVALKNPGQDLLPPYLAGTLDNFAALFGGSRPRPLLTGVLWDAKGQLQLQPERTDRASAEEQVRTLLRPGEQPLALNALPPERPASR